MEGRAMGSGAVTATRERATHAAHPLVFGEIHTSLLQTSAALSSAETRQLLSVVPGHQAQTIDRPVQYARSPLIITGLDCELSNEAGTVAAHAIGTAAARATITGGHVLQASSFVRLQRSDGVRRRRWSHYLSQPGMVQLIGQSEAEHLGAFEMAFIRRPRGARVIDLGSVSAAVVNHVQISYPTLLNGVAPLRVSRTQLRWSARVGDALNIRFSLEGPQLRTIRLTVREHDLPFVAAFCEDVALHDWLLTGVLQIVDRTRAVANDSRTTANRLRPVLDHLVHLWMPAARHNRRVASLWRSLERGTGFNRQWDALKDRVRDKFSAAAADALINPVKNAI
jgi:hypothetical protein